MDLQDPLDSCKIVLFSVKISEYFLPCNWTFYNNILNQTDGFVLVRMAALTKCSTGCVSNGSHTASEDHLIWTPSVPDNQLLDTPNPSGHTNTYAQRSISISFPSAFLLLLFCQPAFISFFPTYSFCQSNLYKAKSKLLIMFNLTC